MKRHFFCLLLVTFALMANAQYKVDNLDGKCYLAGAYILDNLKDNDIFANLVIWVQNKSERPGMDFFSKLDYLNRQMEIQTIIKEKKNTYTGVLKLDVLGGIIKFRVEDIVLQTNSMMSQKLIPFEKLQPMAKPAHKVLIEEFENKESELLSDMINFAKTNVLQPITHWDDIRKKNIVIGMNETECQLAIGRPRIVIDGDELQWQVNSSMYIFFKDGVVSTIVK